MSRSQPRRPSRTAPANAAKEETSPTSSCRATARRPQRLDLGDDGGGLVGVGAVGDDRRRRRAAVQGGAAPDAAVAAGDESDAGHGRIDRVAAARGAYQRSPQPGTSRPWLTARRASAYCDGMDRDGLADFLRRRREALQPEDVGLRDGRRRRTRRAAARGGRRAGAHVDRLLRAARAAPRLAAVGADARRAGPRAAADARRARPPLPARRPRRRRRAAPLRPRHARRCCACSTGSTRPRRSSPTSA